MSRRVMRDLRRLLRNATYFDSYGVDGSDFECCRICDSESGAGMLYKPDWHKPFCPVPELKKRYSLKGIDE